MLKKNNIILASSSASRRKIMDATGIKYTALKPLANEEKLKKNFKGTTKKLALMLAEKKLYRFQTNIMIVMLLGQTKFFLSKGRFTINRKQ